MIIVDTHVLLWWVSVPKKLSRKATRALRASKRIGVPAIVPWEIAMLEEKARIRLDRPVLEWLNEVLEDPRVVLCDLSPVVAVRAARLSATFPGDPADRLVAGTALVEGAPLVTADGRFEGQAGLELIW